MKIVRLQAENFKRLKAIDITPTANTVKITGKNAQGKTSALDAIWAAFGGTRYLPPKPVRDGEQKAVIKITLDDLIVERSITQKGSAVRVMAMDGAAYKSPQAMLTKLLGEKTIDPLEFFRLDPQKQIETVLVLMGLKEPLADLTEKHGELYERRKIINRDIKAINHAIDQAIIPPDTPDEHVDVKKLTDKIDAIRKHNQQLNKEFALRAQLKHSHAEAAAKVETTLKEIAGLQAKLIVSRDLLSEADMALRAQQDKIGNLEHQDEEDAIDALAASGRINRQVDEKKAKRENQDERDTMKQALDAITVEMDGLKDRRTALFLDSDWPVPGMGLHEGMLTYNKIPIEQISDSERLKLSARMAMHAQPEIRVLLVRDGSLLDTDSLKVIEDIAAEFDYQVWIEMVDDSGKIGFYIEEGELKAGCGSNDAGKDYPF